MTLKDKIKLIILSIITLGIYPIVVFRNKNEKSSDTLSEARKISFDYESAIKLLGGADNIIGAEYTHTKVKIIIVTRTKVKIEKLEKLKGVSGIFATRGAITLLVGNQAKLIARKIVK